jgi:hypothetical protein
MQRRLSLVDGLEYVFGIGIKIDDSIERLRERRTRLKHLIAA